MDAVDLNNEWEDASDEEIEMTDKSKVTERKSKKAEKKSKSKISGVKRNKDLDTRVIAWKKRDNKRNRNVSFK